jgi:ferredoxin
VKVSVDLSLCTGHGRCYALCPEIFREDEAGHCEIDQPDVPEKLESKARMAAENCPEQAISVED